MRASLATQNWKILFPVLAIVIGLPMFSASRASPVWLPWPLVSLPCRPQASLPCQLMASPLSLEQLSPLLFSQPVLLRPSSQLSVSVLVQLASAPPLSSVSRPVDPSGASGSSSTREQYPQP